MTHDTMLRSMYMTLAELPIAREQNNLQLFRVNNFLLKICPTLGLNQLSTVTPDQRR